jgi:hypothetical protein
MSGSMMETLEGRELMAGDAVSVAFAGDGLVLERSQLTAPLGSTKGSFAGDGLGSAHSLLADVTDGTSNTILFASFNVPYSYPDHSEWVTFPTSAKASFAGDAYVNEMGFSSQTQPHADGIIAVLIGLVQRPATSSGFIDASMVYGSGEKASFTADAYVNEMGVIGTRPVANGIIAILIGVVQPQQSGGGDLSSLKVVGTQQTPTNGIIAILIGVVQSPQAGGGDASALTVGTQSAKGFYHILPYIEQDNIYKVWNVSAYMEDEGIFYF